MQNVYKALGWEIKPGFVTTNTSATTAVRAPGSIQGVALLENCMEHISHYLKKDPLDVRRVNFLQKGDQLLPTMFGDMNYTEENQMPRLIEEIKKSGDYENRTKFVETFNKVILAQSLVFILHNEILILYVKFYLQENRWKKRGLSLIPIRYPVG